MSLVAKQESNEFELVPAGVYIARCYRVIDLGTQEEVFNGETKKKHKVQVSWELLDKPGDEEAPRQEVDGKKIPFTAHKRYTVSLNENSNLYADLNSWRGKPFTKEELAGFKLNAILGVYCQMQIVHNTKGDKTYANVDTLMQTSEKPDKFNDDVIFDIDNPDQEVFDSLSNNLQETIKKAPEWDDGERAVAAEESKRDLEEPEDSAAKNAQEKVDEKREETKLEDIPF